MRQPLYQLWTSDQPDFNWLTRVTSRDGEYGLRFRYVKFVCPECHRFALDDVFRAGFDPHVRVRARKGCELLMTDDHFLCVAAPVLDALAAACVRGFEHKEIPETPWRVLSITDRRSFDTSAYTSKERPCRACGRRGQYGILEAERQIEPPAAEVTFCSTSTERGQGGYDVFVTEPLVDLIRLTGTKGVSFHRLLTDEEQREAVARREKEPSWRPKGSVVVL